MNGLVEKNAVLVLESVARLVIKCEGAEVPKSESDKMQMQMQKIDVKCTKLLITI